MAGSRGTTPTPKQVLRQHIIERHRKRPAGFDRMTLDQLARWHAGQHHQYGGLDHYHAGENLGPGKRPPGWRTGEDAVTRTDQGRP